jgi:hypothetical protein
MRKLEELCSAAEAQLRYGLEDAAGDTLEKLESELDTIEVGMNVEIMPKNLLLRHKAVSIRAESACESRRKPEQLSQGQGKEYRKTDRSAS